jgi:hypothetical protein
MPGRNHTKISAFDDGFSFKAQIWAAVDVMQIADSFREDLHPGLKADLVPVPKDLANRPFNMSDWGGENLRQDVRWNFGMPPVNNANYAWIQHFIQSGEHDTHQVVPKPKRRRRVLKNVGRKLPNEWRMFKHGCRKEEQNYARPRI